MAHEQSLDGMARWGDDYDRKCAEAIERYRQLGVSDAKARLPMRRTFQHLGGQYCSAEGSAYQRGYRSILNSADEADAVRQKRLF